MIREWNEWDNWLDDEPEWWLNHPLHRPRFTPDIKPPGARKRPSIKRLQKSV
jgi:hypothetical protein